MKINDVHNLATPLLAERAEADCWELHNKIGNDAYKSTHAQLEDMVRLGKMAAALLKLREGLNTLSSLSDRS